MCSVRAGMLGLQRAVGNSAVAGVAEEERSPVPDVVGSAGNSAASGLVRLALSGKGPEAIMEVEGALHGRTNSGLQRR